MNSGRWNRTTVCGVKGRGLTIRRYPKAETLRAVFFPRESLPTRRL